jgi:DNA polymerase-3 subunit epsilon
VSAPWHTQPLLSWDTETTGLDIETARIVTAAFVWHNPDGTHETTTLLADPGVEIPTEASDLHGVTTERARAEGKPAAEAVENITDRLYTALSGGLPIVIFNARYDLSVLDRECRRHGIPTLEERLGQLIGPVIDPLVIDKQADKYRKGSRKLGAMAAHYGIKLANAHSADADALASVKIALALAEKYPALQVEAAKLHGWQAGWAAEQARSFRDYRARQGQPVGDIHEAWPIVPVPAPTPHQPARGDAVEQWLKAQRDAHLDGYDTPPPGWHALDRVLAAYRNHADTGTPLGHFKEVTQ